MKRYPAERAEIKTFAERLEGEAVAFDEKGNDALREHHHWAQATTALQISIAMTTTALLTKRPWLQYGVFSLGAIGTASGVLARLQV